MTYAQHKRNPMLTDYEAFISNKHFRQPESGFAYKCPEASPLRDYQRAAVEWALARGKAAIFKDTGLGKTLDELEFGHAVAQHTRAPVLHLAPLAVGHQINREAAQFGYKTKIIRGMDDVDDCICITNYENLHNIEFSRFAGIVLDESSIMKGMQGKIRGQLTEGGAVVPYRLSATATPAPNDFMELGTQSEFLGIMTQVEMLATFFIHDGGDTAKWRLKGHGRQKFFEWLATWSIIMRDPSDYGFSPLPPLPRLDVRQVEIETQATDALFPTVAQSLSDRLQARRETLRARCEKAAEIVNGMDGPVLVWCGLNDEGDLLESLIDGAVQVAGADSDENKAARMLGFSAGEHRVLITKPKLAGFGMNWQHCNQMVFVGLSDSFEQYYQAIRRCWRQGQKRDVTAWVVTADSEGAVVENIRRKQMQADEMMAEMAKIAASFFKGFDKARSELISYQPQVEMILPPWLSKSAANEEWREIFDGYYSVSNYGMVRRNIGGKGARVGLLAQPRDGAGYPMTSICIGGVRKAIRTHVLVAEQFLGPRPEGLQINHKDGNKANNRIDNLEYVTHSENGKHAWDTGLQPKRRVGERA